MTVHNTFSGKNEPFSPLRKNKVTMYVCGITPYDTTHLGHAFTYVFFDVVYRYLTFLGYEVVYTQNVTDIDDDLLKKAKEEDQNWKKLGTFWTNKFLKDLKNLRVIMPTHYVKATDSIPVMIEIIAELIKNGHGYIKNGNVYFDVETFSPYGKLSKLTKKQMIPLLKDRGGDPNDPLKKNPLDFVLWRASKPGEPSWKNPWSKASGRPGWHIECSAMIYRFLGEQIDIHGGGNDLVFPHHESEIAQAESFTGKEPFVKYWMHVGMVKYKGEKISKSLGNLIMVSQLLKKYAFFEIRFMLLSHHYRRMWEFKEIEMENASLKMKLIKKALNGEVKHNSFQANASQDYQRGFYEAMENDFDIPAALIFLVESAKLILKEKNTKKKEEAQKQLFQALSILGLV